MVGNTKVMKNVANTSVLWWGRRLFCLWEGGDPYEIQVSTLDTIGKFEVTCGGKLRSRHGREVEVGVWDMVATMLKPILYGVYKMPPKRLLSHYKVDAGRNRLLIMSCNPEDLLLPRSNFTFYVDAKERIRNSRPATDPRLGVYGYSLRCVWQSH
ncbi:Carotenoid cleavage dioxygenase 7, chloroplastic [Sarracenia purpurea var. burkii]